MRRVRARLSLAAGAFSVSVALAACGSSSTSSTSRAEASGSASSSGSSSGATVPNVQYAGPEIGLPTSVGSVPSNPKRGLTFGWLPPTSTVPTFKTLYNEMEARAKALGDNVITKESNFQPNQQATAMNEFIAQKVGAIIVYPILPATLGPSIAKAKAAGIPVISMDTPSDAGLPVDPGYVTDVSLGRDHSAYDEAKALAEAQPNGKVGQISISLPVPALTYTAAQQKYWAKKFGLNMVGTSDAASDSAQTAATAMSGLLSAHPDIQGLFSYNDVSGLAALGVARTDHKQIKIVSINGSSPVFAFIKAGQYLGTSKENLACTAREMVDSAVIRISTPSQKIPTRVLCMPTMVTKANVNNVQPNG